MYKKETKCTHSPNIRLTLECIMIRQCTDMKKLPQYAGHLHRPPGQKKAPRNPPGKTRRSRNPTTTAPSKSVETATADLGKQQRQQRGHARLVLLAIGEHIGIPQVNPAVRNRQFLSLPHHNFHLRSNALILHGRDFPPFFVRAAVRIEQVLERRLGRREFAGEAIDHYSLHQVAGKPQIPALAQNLGGRYIECTY
ncbi:aurora kinase A [Striga asiatica]|uniref:Aurora kinase A n=1 Tax=Striga asiatica TaxID=4170 RepID=A0A5A7QN67_STRAF|nr:aurora kinase A [Striga asiatica]